MGEGGVGQRVRIPGNEKGFGGSKLSALSGSACSPLPHTPQPLCMQQEPDLLRNVHHGNDFLTAKAASCNNYFADESVPSQCLQTSDLCSLSRPHTWCVSVWGFQLSSLELAIPRTQSSNICISREQPQLPHPWFGVLLQPPSTASVGQCWGRAELQS